MSPSKPREEAGTMVFRLLRYLGNPEGQSKEELRRESLEEEVDSEKIKSQLLEKVKGLIAEGKRTALHEQAEQNMRAFQELVMVQEDVPDDDGAIRERIAAMLSSASFGQLAAVHFRNFKEMPPADLRRAYSDFLALVKLEKGKKGAEGSK